MTQKTFVLNWVSMAAFNYNTPKVGQEVLLVCRSDTKNGDRWEAWRAKPLGESFSESEGVGGNVNSSIKRFHGWRGTTNNVYLSAHGVRKITKVSENADGDIKITVGRDIHPNWK